MDNFSEFLRQPTTMDNQLENYLIPETDNFLLQANTSQTEIYPDIKECLKQCQQQKSVSPMTKKYLKLNILNRRHKEGLEPIDLTFSGEKKYVLGPEEELKRHKRREQNRIAAAKCRNKKKTQECTMEIEVFKQLERRKELKRIVLKLQGEKERVLSILCSQIPTLSVSSDQMLNQSMNEFNDCIQSSTTINAKDTRERSASMPSETYTRTYSPDNSAAQSPLYYTDNATCYNDATYNIYNLQVYSSSAPSSTQLTARFASSDTQMYRNVPSVLQTNDCQSRMHLYSRSAPSSNTHVLRLDVPWSSPSSSSSFSASSYADLSDQTLNSPAKSRTASFIFSDPGYLSDTSETIQFQNSSSEYNEQPILENELDELFPYLNL